MIYLDNSSTTHNKPLSVRLATLQGLSKLSVNPSRSGHKLAIAGAQKVYEARENLSDFLGTTPENVIFTSGCTMAINLALRGTVKKGGHIITTIYEHNSVLRTLDYLKKNHNIEVTYLTPNKFGLITTKDIQNKIKKNTYLIVINHTSNVTGATQDIESIGKLCKKRNLLFMVDGAQSIGHIKINMQEQNINLLTLAGHKGLYAPEGIGALLINNCTVSPIVYGGTGTYSDKENQPSESPDGLEAGTINLPGILGLNAGVDFVRNNFEKINNKIERLSSKLIHELNRIKNVKVYGNEKAGVVSISIKDKDSSYVSNILDEKYNIYTRSGLHCAPRVHKYLGTNKTGLTRLSLSYYNTSRDITKVISAIKEIALD